MASRPEPVTPILVSPVQPPDASGLAALLQYEADVRRRTSVNELVYHVANETRAIVAYDQMFVLRQPRVAAGFQVQAASSLATVDRNAPLVQALEGTLSKLATTHDLKAAQDFQAKSYSSDEALTDYPFPYWRWQPLLDSEGAAFGGLLIARGTPLREGEAFRLERIAETVSHSWRALTANRPVSRLPKIGRKEKRGLTILAALIALFPVRMSVLAPVEVVPERPFVVAAPFAGVIARIEVAPNTVVQANQVVLTFEDVKVRNELQQATERLSVAKAKIERASSAAFGDKEQARELAPLRAEYEAAQADYNYARDVMAKSQIATPMAGMAIYSDRRDWEGRAVSVGEPIMQIADPKAVSYRVELPVKEQLTLNPGAPVKIWLDAQPLWSLAGKVEQASYQARPTPGGVLAFAVTAKPDGPPPRIGSRGTAKLYGNWAPFIYTVLRRPIASLRQFAGL